MKVKELIELLNAHDATAEVSMMIQSHYPHEHRIEGITLREECRGYSDVFVPRREGDGAPGDVILVEGEWLRYGDRAAWRAVRSRRR